MTMAAYATVLGKKFEDKDFKENFINYFEVLILIEETLLDSYQDSISHLRDTDK